MNRINGVGEIKFDGDKSKIQIIGEEIDNKFLAAIKGLQLSPEAVKQYHDLKIIYTPIHGVVHIEPVLFGDRLDGLGCHDSLYDIFFTCNAAELLVAGHDVAGISLVRKGKTGAEEIVAIMKSFRENPPKQLAGSDVVTVKDYADLNMKNLKTGEITKMDMPTTSNVLQFFTADGTKVATISSAPVLPLRTSDMPASCEYPYLMYIS